MRFHRHFGALARTLVLPLSHSARRRIAPVIATAVLLGAAVLVGAAAPARATQTSGEPHLACEQIPKLLQHYLQKHISFHYLNDELRSRAVNSYVKRLDPSKTLLLESEAEALRTSLMGIFHDVRNGNCAPLDSLQENILLRYESMAKFAKEFISPEGYELDTDVTLILDPEKRGHPDTKEEQEELYRKLIHFQMSNYLNAKLEMPEAKEKLVHHYELIYKRAAERDQIDIYSIFLDSFASALDPHSNYLSAEAMEDFQIGMGLSLEGIGVALSSSDGYSVVEKIIPGGAADRLNVLVPKDKVIAVAQEEGEPVDVIDMSLRDVVRLIRGKRGTNVRLTVLRQGETTERFDVTIERDKINLEEQAAKLTFEEVEVGDETLKLAILDLPSFYGGRNPNERQSSRDVRELLEQVALEKADGLLLDLSRNGGGLLENSVEIAGFFIDEGGIVAHKNTFEKTQVLRDPDGDIVYDGPLVVLISRASASASEIVTGAMKDYRRAVVVGDDHTFGKGTVQSMIPLPPGLGALKVTTALFFRPGGNSTQNDGVASDIVLPSAFNTDEFGERHQEYSLPNQQIQSFLADKARSNEVPWSPVTSDVISYLGDRSSARVEADEEFAEMERKLEESRKRNGVLVLSEILEERKGEETEKDDGADGEAAPSSGEDATDAEATGEDADSEGASGEAKGSAQDGDETATASADTEADPQADPEEEQEPSPQQREAVRILADYVAMTQSKVAMNER